MSLLVIEHHPDETSSRLGEICQSLGHRLDVCKPFDGDALPPDLDNVDGLIVMGGPQNVDQTEAFAYLDDEMAIIKAAHKAGLPIVGVCLGAQLIAQALGGSVGPMETPEVGWHDVNLAFPGTIDPVYAGIGWRTPQFHMHGYEVTDLPPGSTPLAGSKICRNQAFRVGLTTYAFQYHFEWTADEIKQFAQVPLVERSDTNSADIISAITTHYDAYRRLGDRLSQRIGDLLFPIDKRLAKQH